MNALLTPDEVAGRLRLPSTTLAQWRYLGRGPAYVKIGRHVRYRGRDLSEWLDKQTVAADHSAPSRSRRRR